MLNRTSLLYYYSLLWETAWHIDPNTKTLTNLNNHLAYLSMHSPPNIRIYSKNLTKGVSMEGNNLPILNSIFAATLQKELIQIWENSKQFSLWMRQPAKCIDCQEELDQRAIDYFLFLCLKTINKSTNLRLIDDTRYTSKYLHPLLPHLFNFHSLPFDLKCCL